MKNFTGKEAVITATRDQLISQGIEYQNEVFNGARVVIGRLSSRNDNGIGNYEIIDNHPLEGLYFVLPETMFKVRLTRYQLISRLPNNLRNKVTRVFAKNGMSNYLHKQPISYDSLESCYANSVLPPRPFFALNKVIGYDLLELTKECYND